MKRHNDIKSNGINFKDLRSHSSKKTTNIVFGAISVVFWLLVWQIASLLVNRTLLLPAPIDVFIRLTQLVRESSFWITAGFSLLRILIGFAVGFASGIITATAVYKLSVLTYFITPLIGIIKATPVASFIVLALVWIDKGSIPVFTAFLMVFPIIYSNTFASLTNLDKQLAEMIKIYDIPPQKQLMIYYIPSALPYIRSGVVTATGMAWKAGIAAEVLCSPLFSIGKHIYESKLYLETTDLFAWTAVVIILSIILETVFKKAFSPKDSSAVAKSSVPNEN